MARPKKLKADDYKTVEKLASYGLTKEMIADYLNYSYSTMYTDVRFSEVYKKGLSVLGAKVRTTLLKKMELDTTANIYLDKVINKTTEKFQDENVKLKKEQLEIERQKLKIDDSQEDKTITALEVIAGVLKNGK
ncbi:MAG: hypothetical protein ACRCX2_27325 [Paraclostridium sp.]